MCVAIAVKLISCTSPRENGTCLLSLSCCVSVLEHVLISLNRSLIETQVNRSGDAMSGRGAAPTNSGAGDASDVRTDGNLRTCGIFFGPFFSRKQAALCLWQPGLN